MEKFNTCPICGSKHIIAYKNGLIVCQSCDVKFVYNRAEDPISGLYREAVRSTLEIVSSVDGDDYFGTGTIVSAKGYSITSSHIIASVPEPTPHIRNLCDIVSVRPKDAEDALASEIVYTDNTLDIALLYSEALVGGVPVEFDRSTPQIGDKIYVIGNSKGEGLCMVDGIVSDSLRIVNGRKLTMISAPVTNGYSGGPVLNKNGKMIGMVTGGRKDATAMNYSVPAESILKFIEEAQKKTGIVL